jgi:formylglycine-generating enzyme required for sulfatase activity
MTTPAGDDDEAKLSENSKPQKPAPPVGTAWTNSLGMTFAWIPPGSFMMGSPDNEPGRATYKGACEAQHEVTLTKGFYLGMHPLFPP